MTTGGWITMILSVGAVVSLFIWCIYRVLTHNPATSNVTEQSIHAKDD